MADDWVTVSCGRCDERFQVQRATYEVWKRSAQTWYCPHGHQRHFPLGESQEIELQREVNQLRQNMAYLEDRRKEAEARAERERHRANGYKGHATKLTKRAKAGVCPCCNRTFQQLARHMASQHPRFTPIDVDQVPDGATVQ